MVDVTTKSTTPSGLQIAGVSLQVFGALMSASESSRGLKFDAREVLREGKLAALRMREEGERVQSAQRTGFAKGGVILSGTPLEVMAETANIAESNALEIERSAARQAKELRRAARRKKRAGIFGAAGAAVGGIYGGPAGAAAGYQIGSSVGGGT
jgi:hypothetical protein